MLTKQMIVKMIETATPEKRARIVGSACVALFNRQIESEKASNSTNVTNMRGFTSSDARSGSLTAKTFLKNGALLDWQVEQWTKVNKRGDMRIVKYWRQLNEIAIEKARRKNAEETSRRIVAEMAAECGVTLVEAA